MAWFKTWPELNLLGFGFTFGLTAFWLSSRYESDEWVSTQPFIALFVLMYVGMPALFAVREAPDLKRMRDGSPAPGTPFVRGAWDRAAGVRHAVRRAGACSSWRSATRSTAPPSAPPCWRWSRARWRWRRAGWAPTAANWRRPTPGSVWPFSAIAVPLALDANFTSAAWAVQGLVLVWLGCRSGRLLALGGGAGLQALAALSFAVHLGESLPYANGTPALVNEFFLGALLLAAAGLVSGWLLARRPQRGEADHLLEGLALGWGIAWWLGSGLMEIVQQLPEGDHLSAALAFVAGSFVVGSLSARRLRWPHLEAAGVLIVPTLAVALLVSLATQSHPLDRWGWAAWPAAFAAHWLFLRRREESFSPVAAVLHAAGFWTLAALVAREVYWQVDGVADGVWPLAATAAAALVLAGATMAARRGQSWPVGVHWRTFLLACAGPLLAMAAAVVLAAAVLHEGDPRPLLFLPVLNPLGVLVGMQLAASLAWRRMAGGAARPSVPAPGRCPLDAGAGRGRGGPGHHGDGPHGEPLAGRGVGRRVAVGRHDSAVFSVGGLGADRAVGDGRRREAGPQDGVGCGCLLDGGGGGEAVPGGPQQPERGRAGRVVHRGRGPAADRRISRPGTSRRDGPARRNLCQHAPARPRPKRLTDPHQQRRPLGEPQRRRGLVVH